MGVPAASRSWTHALAPSRTRASTVLHTLLPQRSVPYRPCVKLTFTQLVTVPLTL